MNFIRSICCLTLLSLGTGCAGWNRAGMYPASGLAPVGGGVAIPSQVTPQSDPTRANKPVDPAPVDSPEQPAETFKTPLPEKPQQPDSTSPPVPEQRAVPEDRPSSPVQGEDNWRPSSPANRAEPPKSLDPLQRPTRSPAPPASSGIDLGPPAPFPSLPKRDQSTDEHPQPVDEERPRPVAKGLTNISEARPAEKPHRPQGWELTLQSTGQRPLQVARSISGPSSDRVFLMGSLSGLETESVQLLDQLLDSLKAGPLPRANTAILRTPNPDGIAEHTRTNLNGVDLNRNFPSTRFTAIPTQLTGPHPASELETQHVMRLVRDFAPTRLIHIRSSVSSRPLVMFNKRAANSFAKAELPKDIDYAVYTGDFKAGSIEEFGTLRLDAEVITIQLPLEGFRSLQPEELLHFVDLRTSSDAASMESRISTPSTPPQPPAPDVSDAIAAERPDGKLGYVELLPPPPYVSSARGDFDGDPRYYELPPPTGE